MKRLLIIMANHSPNPSSVANCMEPLIEKLSKKYQVDIVTDRKRLDTSKFETKKNIRIYRLDDLRAINTYYCNKLNNINSVSHIKLITAMLTKLLKSLYYLQYVFFSKEKRTGGWETKRILKKCIDLFSENNYDLIISVSLPFRSHYVAEKLKEIVGNKLKWIVFEFDPFALNNEIQTGTMLRKIMYKDEKRIFEKCDKVFLTPELYKFYYRKGFGDFNDKFIKIPFANLNRIHYDKNNVSQNFMNANKINCLFTGRLYEDIRNPSELLDLFSKLNSNIHLTLMTNMNMNTLKKYIPSNCEVSVIPFQNRDTALYNLIMSDILVNIGNTVEFQIPGKIFEYMSTGKPIIHFSKIKNDPVIEYLERYPMKLVVNEWEIDKLDYIEKLEKFCNNYQNHKLSFEKVNESLGEYSGEAVQDKFSNIINDMLGDKVSNE